MARRKAPAKARPEPSAAPDSRDPRDHRDIPLFREPDRHSVWPRLIFDPMYDPFDIMQSVFMVRTKAATIVPFRPFYTQRQYVSELGLRNVIVKPRQVGMSTVNLGLMTANAITCPNVNTLIVTHLDETTATMRQTVLSFINWLNEYYQFGVEIGKNNADQLEIKTTGSWIFFGTAGGKGVGRSRTVQQLLCSELAHWQSSDPGAELGGMLESVPDNGFVVAESTPNGAEGPFYELYHGSGRSRWKPHFFPWFIEPSRRIPLGGRKLHLTEEENILVTLHSLSHEQIAWRRNKMREMQAVGLDFLQEYPEDDITCFTAGVRAYFPAARMNVYMRQAQATPYQSEAWPGDPWDPGGNLRVYEPPRAGLHYIVAGDVGGGHKDGDMSVAMVMCHETGQVAAVLAGWWKPQKFADLTIELALRYNEAYLSHESNSIGQGAVDQAVYTRRPPYKNYHWEKRSTYSRDGVIEEWAPGFAITANQRTPLLNDVLQEVIDGTFQCRDLDTVRQFTAARLEKVKSGGGWRDAVVFPKSVHDDYAMAYAQALALRKQLVIVNDRPKPARVA